MANLANPPDSADSQPPADETLFERRMKIVQIRNMPGATFAKIATQLGISQAQVRKDHTAGLREYMKSSIEERIAWISSLHHDLVRANYLKALGGDHDAGRLVLSAAEAERKMFGLDAPTRSVVAVSDVEFAEQLAVLIREMGAGVPEELAALVPGAGIRRAQLEAIDAEFVDDEQKSATEDDGHPLRGAPSESLSPGDKNDPPAADHPAGACADEKHAFSSKKAPADAAGARADEKHAFSSKKAAGDDARAGARKSMLSNSKKAPGAPADADPAPPVTESVPLGDEASTGGDSAADDGWSNI